MIVVVAHLEVDLGLTVEEGLLNLMIHVDPWRPSDAPTHGAEGQGEYRTRLSVARFDDKDET